MDCWTGVDPIVKVKDIYLVKFTLCYIEDGRYAISLGLGDGREEHCY
jgi:hypothetical protein